MMDSLPHLLNIGTLATWLSVAGFGSVGIIVPNRPAVLDSLPAVADSPWLARDFTLGGDTSPAAPESPPTITAAAPAETLPAPPAMPDLADLAPLPELPAPPPFPQAAREIAPTPQPTARANPQNRPPRRAAGQPATTGGTGGTGMAAAARLAAGSMPPPDYPAEARRRGQTGTLLIEFTVDASGRVIAASAVSASPWPLLNEEAVRAVRSWKFPPGTVMKLQRPIVFQLR